MLAVRFLLFYALMMLPPLLGIGSHSFAGEDDPLSI
jgi:hypothetical protein